jgi:hypothetical protein
MKRYYTIVPQRLEITMKLRLILTITVLTIASQTSANPAMSVVTVNSEDPQEYVEWAKRSGVAIGEAINAIEGGVCISDAGFYAPGELYYFHTFPNHASAVGSSIYNDTVRKAAKKLKVERTVTRSDFLSLVMAEELVNEVGEVFSTWNILLSTEDPGLFRRQLERINDVATEFGFGDVSLAAYTYLTGEDAGNMMVVVRGPTNKRLGEFLDQLNSDWMAPIMSDLASMRSYQRGFMTTCTVTFISGM